MTPIKSIIRIAFAVFFIVLHTQSKAQNNRVLDSLRADLSNKMHDTNRVRTLALLSWEHAGKSNYDSALFFGEQGLALSEKIDYKTGIANSCNNLGIIQRNMGNYQEATNNFFKSLKVWEELKVAKGIGNAYISIGQVYQQEENYNEALKFYQQALAVFEQSGGKAGLGRCYNNLGIVYRMTGNNDEALKYYNKALQIAEETGNKRSVAYAHSNIGVVYAIRGEHLKALENFIPVIKILEDDGDKAGVASTHINIGMSRLELGEYKQAKKELEEGLAIAVAIGHKEWMQNAYKGLMDHDSATGNWKGAFTYRGLYMQTRDQLTNDENLKKTVQQRMQYEFDKKEAVSNAEDEKREIKNAEEQRKQRLVSQFLIGGLVLVLIVAFVIFRSLRANQRKNRIIILQKKEVERQKDIVEEKQKAILDSINYAKRIQNALMPGERYISRNLRRMKEQSAGSKS